MSSYVKKVDEFKICSYYQYIHKDTSVTKSMLIKSLKYSKQLCPRGVVDIATAQLHSTNCEIKFCTGSNPARGASEIRDGENL